MSPERGALRRVLGTVVPVVIGVALLVGVLPAIADLSEVWEEIRAMNRWQVAVLFVAAAWNIVTYLLLLMAALPRLTIGQAFVVSQMSTAISNTVPAGSAVGVGITYAVCTSFGHGAGAIALAAVVSGIWNTFVKLGLPIVALAILAVQGNANAGLVSAAFAGLGLLVAALAVFALILRRERVAFRIGDVFGRAASLLRRLVRRPPVADWGRDLVAFRRRSVGLLQARWHWLTASALLSHLSLFFLLFLSLRFVGIGHDDLRAAEILGAFALVRLVTALPLTPGGIGLVEVGLTAALVVAGGDEAPVVAGVLVYRALSYALQVPFGVASYLVWRANPRWHARPDATPV